jgi:hypothetical protein
MTEAIPRSKSPSSNTQSDFSKKYAPPKPLPNTKSGYYAFGLEINS